jgi:hypothetical protein
MTVLLVKQAGHSRYIKLWLDTRRATGGRTELCVGCEVIAVAGVLLAKLLEGHPASFVRLEGDAFIVSVNGQERSVSRDVWRSLSELEGQRQGRLHHLDHRP